MNEQLQLDLDFGETELDKAVTRLYSNMRRLATKGMALYQIEMLAVTIFQPDSRRKHIP